MIYKVINDIIYKVSLQDCIDFVIQEDIIALDTETQGFDCHTKKLLSVQIGNNSVQFFIDAQKNDIKWLSEYLINPDKLWLFANYKFDAQFLLKNIGVQCKNIYDVFLAECILTTGYKEDEKDLSLKGMAKKYCNADLNKAVRGKINYLGTENEEVIIYGVNDVKWLHDIRLQQLQQIEVYELEKVLDLENKCVRVLALEEFHGICLDPAKLTKVAELTEANVKKYINELDDLIIDKAKSDTGFKKYINTQTNLFEFDEAKTFINWNSPDQKKKILKQLGIKVDDVSDKTLQKLKSTNPIAKTLIELSKNQKLSTSFGKGLLKFVNPVTKRVHTTQWQVLSSGRISASDPNLSQIPSHGEVSEAIKNSFVATMGWKIVSADYSAMELRELAEYSQEPLWLEIFNQERDLHSELCALTFNIPLDKVNYPFPAKPDKSYRFIQKTCNFLVCYGGSKFKLSETAQIPVDVADKVIKKFFQIVPKVKRFLDGLADLGVSRGYIKSDPYWKRRRWFTDYPTTDPRLIGSIGRASRNTPLQSSNANVTKQALVWLQDIIDENSYPVRILITIHDKHCVVSKQC